MLHSVLPDNAGNEEDEREGHGRRHSLSRSCHSSQGGNEIMNAARRVKEMRRRKKEANYLSRIVSCSNWKIRTEREKFTWHRTDSRTR